MIKTFKTEDSALTPQIAAAVLAPASGLMSGDGDDTYYVPGDVVVENPGGGTDLVVSSVSYALPANVENLTLTGTDDLNGLGNELNNVITGNSGNNALMGGLGDDSLYGGSGSDTMWGAEGTDWLYGGDGPDLFDGGPGVNHFSGGAGNDYLHTYSATHGSTYDGGDDWDFIDFGWITDAAGLNIQLYIWDEGTGTVFGQVSNRGTPAWTDSLANIEHARGSQGGDVITGWVFGSYIDGSGGDDSIQGMGYGDTLIGGDGNDSLDGFGGADSLEGDGGNDNSHGGLGNDYIDSSTGDDWLFGEGGNDTLIGGAGTDHMFGGDGDDTYYVDTTNDVVSEEFNGEGVDDGGIDMVYASATFTLGYFIESLWLQGAGTLDGTGNDLANKIWGNNSDNVLTGLGGNDSLLGQGGHDVISGGAGADIIRGNDGDDTIIGGAGNDAMTGNDGNDIFLVNGALEGYDSYDGGAGTDTILTQSNGTVIRVGTMSGIEAISANGFSNVTIAMDDLGRSLNLSAATLTGIVSINGGSGNDFILGSAGNDSLNGKGGFDKLAGGAGADTFVFSAAANTPVGIADLITDFNQSQHDLIDLHLIDANSVVAGDQAFTFIGSGAFTHVAGQLRYDNLSTTHIYGDINGDGIADFEIALTGNFTLVTADLFQ